MLPFCVFFTIIHREEYNFKYLEQGIRMKKRIFITTILAFIIIMLILTFLLKYNDINDKLFELIIKYYGNTQLKNIENILKIFKLVVAFIGANIVGLMNFLLSYKKSKREHLPSVSICIVNTTMLRKDEISHFKPCIEIGEGNLFRYLTIDLKNNGNITISNITNVEKNNVCSILDKDSKITFYIKINRFKNRNYKRLYTIKLKLQDEQNKNHFLNIKIVYKKSTECFTVKNTKLKRS